MSIFVSIAAFCEPHLEFTLDGLFRTAKAPDQITVALVDQSLDNNRSWLSQKSYWPSIRYIQIDPIDSQGAAWARNIAFSLYKQEDYFLQIDSHTLFDPNWDEKLIGYLQTLQQHSSHPILTTYPPPFEFNDADEAVKTAEPKALIYRLTVRDGNSLTEDDPTLGFHVSYFDGGDFMEGFHVAAGFLFTLGAFVEDIPYDPFMYFHGEEQNIAIRAYTRGWTIFHPKHSLIPLYHLYKQKDNAYKSHHWHQDYEAQRKIKWGELNKRALARLANLVYRGGTGIYGLGKQRTLADFARLSGIDYLNKTLAPAPTQSIQSPLPSTHPLEQTLQKDALKVTGGWQCKVYVYASHVFKVMRTYEETLALVTAENQNGKPPEVVTRYLHEAAPPSLALIESTPGLRRATANFERVAEGVYIQDLCYPFGDVIRRLARQQDLAGIRQQFEKLLAFIESLWAMGILETSWKFNKNYGLNQHGEMVLMDCLELTNRPKRIQRHLEEQRWVPKNQRFFNLLRPGLREEIESLLAVRLTFARYLQCRNGQ